MQHHYMDQEAHLEHIYWGSHEVLKGLADIVESLEEHSTCDSEQASENEKPHQ